MIAIIIINIIIVNLVVIIIINIIRSVIIIIIYKGPLRAWEPSPVSKNPPAYRAYEMGGGQLRADPPFYKIFGRFFLL